jgi:hypothetical protein
MSFPSLSFTGGSAKSGVEGDQRQDGAWYGGARTKVVNFTGSGPAVAGAASGGTTTMPVWAWIAIAAAAVVALVMLRRTS